MSNDTLLREYRDEIAVLTINRPECLNALDYATIDELLIALEEISSNAHIRVAILTGAGDRAFSSGADIRALAASISRGASVAAREFAGRGQRLTTAVETCPKPIIVAVNGLACGAGCEITEAAPLAIASDRASFAKPEINLGFPPPFGGTQRLPRLVGRKRALAMILTGAPISATQAADIGLINYVVPHERLVEEAILLARSVTGKSPDAVSASLAAVTRGLNVSIGEGLAIEAMQFAAVADSDGVRTGINRFLNRHHRFGGGLKVGTAD